MAAVALIVPLRLGSFPLLCRKEFTTYVFILCTVGDPSTDPFGNCQRVFNFLMTNFKGADTLKFNMKMSVKLSHFWYMYKWDVLAVVFLLLLSGLPRLLDLGTFLTADEKNWIGRSYEFVRAFKDFRFNDMLQTTHPGVTTLWSSGVSIVAVVFLRHIPFSFQNLRHFVTASQFPVALLNTLAVPAMYLLLRKLLPGRWLPFLAAALVALDPFLIGYSRVAHVDSLLASFLWLAALAVMVYVKELYDRRYLIIAALLAAAALLTKVPAIYIIPFFGLVLLVTRPDFIRHAFWRKARARDLVEWLLLIVLLVMIVWPALLFVPNPQGNVLQLKRDFVNAAVTPHDTNEEYSLNVWHYPAAIITRTTPITLVFTSVLLVVFLWEIIALWRTSEKSSLRLLSGNNRIVLLFIAYAFFFLIMMTLGAKKGDRYILPVWPALDTLAALGIGALVIYVRRFVRRTQVVMPIAAVVVIVLLGITVGRYHPYEIAYSSPLFPDNLSQELGWGEGLDQVATWFNTNAPDAIVASWYPEEVRAFTSARVIHINGHQQNQVQYVVLYKNMFGRSPEHYANDFIDEYYKKKEPVFIAHVAGKEFAWVYQRRAYERIVGELVPGKEVSQVITPQFNKLAGIEFLPATYSGLAKTGLVNIRVIEQRDTKIVGQWTVNVSEMVDNEWQRLLFTNPVDLAGQSLLIEFVGTDTVAGAAPTIRYASKYDYRPGDWQERQGSGVIKARTGDLAIRLLYQGQKDFIGEEDAKLLK